MAQIAQSSAFFIYRSFTDPNKIPFVKQDAHQYLYDWSSGHGIVQTVKYIKRTAETQKILVLTEGYFGTLPDGVLMYLHRQNVNNIFVEGIGQPVLSIPQKMIAASLDYQKVILVVNSHRLMMRFDQKLLLGRYCRPYDSSDSDSPRPCLEIWDITEYAQAQAQEIE